MILKGGIGWAEEADTVPAVNEDVPPVEVQQEVPVQAREMQHILYFCSSVVHSSHKCSAWSYYFAGMLE